LASCTTDTEVLAIAERPNVKHALANAPDDVKEEIGGMLAEAYGRCIDATDMDAANEPSDAREVA
jgi:hypothetical protein